MWVVELLKFLWLVVIELTPFTVINHYDRGAVLRLGKYRRTLEPGLRFRWPLVDQVLTARVTISTLVVKAQSMHTLDGVQVTAILIIRYRINNVKPYLLDIENREDILGDTAPGIFRRLINHQNYNELNGEELENDVAKRLREKVNKYGFKIYEVTVPTFAKVKVIRLITDGSVAVEEE